MDRGRAAVISAVVDTMVFAYALLGTPRFKTEAVRVLEAVDVAIVPDSIRAELLSAVWQSVRAGAADLGAAQQVLADADALFGRVVSAGDVWARALELAVGRSHPSYDAVFVAVAEREAVPVVTYDEKVLRTFPEFAVSPRAFLRALA